MQLRENVPLAPLTTFGVGGAAAFLAAVKSVEELQQALDFARDKSLAVLIFGGGSNMLVPDTGWVGLVIKIEIKGVHIEEGSSATKKNIVAGAGEGWDGLVERAVQEKLWGIENLSGIPGTVGGAVVQNIGAYGAALSQTLAWAEVYDTHEHAIKRLTNAECGFDYRESVFSAKGGSASGGKYVVLRAAFTLSAEPKANVSYKDLAARFILCDVEGFDDSSIDIQAVRSAVLEIRKGKFPDLAVEGTAGSFFKNPILPIAAARALKEQYPDMPLFDMPETSGVKVPLAWLLDHVLNCKGASLGGARLYEKQPLVIVVKKNSSASDVQALAQKIKNEVKEKLGIDLEEEVKII